MNNDNYLKALFSWNYFCSLCDMLENTMNYIDHSDKKNMKVYSFELKKIILLTAIEFENVGKCLCKEINPNTNVERYTIIDITENIITTYPKMKSISINNDYMSFIPLKGWGIDISNRKLKGLKWWPKYNEIKHQSYESIKEANLSNAINALASLMILDIYYIKKLTNSNNIMTNKPCPYFLNQYKNDLLSVSGLELPDTI